MSLPINQLSPTKLAIAITQLLLTTSRKRVRRASDETPNFTNVGPTFVKRVGPYYAQRVNVKGSTSYLATLELPINNPLAVCAVSV